MGQAKRRPSSDDTSSTPAPSPVLMTVDEVAVALRISRRTALRLLAEGRIETVQVTSRKTLVRPEALTAYVESAVVPATVNRRRW